jgi:hypothetical protein
MGMMDSVRNFVGSWLMGDAIYDKGKRERLANQQEHYYYYIGNQRRQIKPKPDQADDNLIHNFAMLIVDRSLSMLLGGGVKFDLEGDAEQEYIDTVWEVNKIDILLHRAAQYASIFGTGYLKIMPDGIEYQNGRYPRLIALDSRWMTINCDPEDMDRVMSYVMEYKVTDYEGNEIGRKEVTARQYTEGRAGDVTDSWLVTTYQLDRHSGGQWREVGQQPWPFYFPPIIHWANLPEPGNMEGRSDLADVIGIQDRINFVSSNISKIIRYHAHPKTWGKGINLGNKVSWGGDEMITVTGDGTIQNLEMQSDLASSQQYLSTLRQSLFDISRTVDISSMSDKLGALTNFGLRVLYTDALAKLHTKQALMGEALEQVNHRMLYINGMPDDPGKVVWSDNVPRDNKADLEADQIELGMGTVSKQTVASENGRDWELEQERLGEEKAASGNIGAEFIRQFNGGL